MRLARISTLEEANHFLRQRSIPEMDRKVAVQAAEPGHAFVAMRYQKLNQIFAVQTERVVANDNNVRVKSAFGRTSGGVLAGCRVTICEHLDGRASILYGHIVARYRYTTQGVPVGGGRPEGNAPVVKAPGI